MKSCEASYGGASAAIPVVIPYTGIQNRPEPQGVCL